MATPKKTAAEPRGGDGSYESGASEKSAKTVTVACKIPHGIVMQLCKETTFWEETMTGPKERKRFDKVGERVFIRGNSRPVNPPPGFPEPHPTAGGYALTPGVDADLWAEWLRQNKDTAMVKNNLIFAMPSADNVRAKAKEQQKVRSGLEPLELEGDPRTPKPQRPELGAITKIDVSAGA